jgi:hypothetical protein
MIVLVLNHRVYFVKKQKKRCITIYFFVYFIIECIAIGL